MIPQDRKAKLGRKQVAEALTEAGYQTSEATLATKACRGGGPPYRLYGRKPVYEWGDCLDWAEGRTSKLISSTSEMEAA